MTEMDTLNYCLVIFYAQNLKKLEKTGSTCEKLSIAKQQVGIFSNAYCSKTSRPGANLSTCA
jgi:hypothetical protein